MYGLLYREALQLNITTHVCIEVCTWFPGQRHRDQGRDSVASLESLWVHLNSGEQICVF